MINKIVSCLAVWFCFMPLVAKAGSPSLSGQDAYQEGLYLQYTRGDLDGAMDSYGRALLGAGPGEHAERVILSQVQCLGWSGRSVQSRELVKQLQSESSGVARDLGRSMFFPPEMALVMAIDLRRLGMNQELQDILRRAKIDLECGGGNVKFEDLISASGMPPLEDLESIAAGLSMSGDDGDSVKHWIVELEFARELDDSVNWKEVVAYFLSRLCEKDSNGNDTPVPFSSKTTQEQGREFLRFAPGNGRQAVPVVTLVKLRDGSVLLGDERSVKDTLASVDQEAPGIRANRKMWHLASALPDDSAFWILVSPHEIRSRVKNLRSLLGWAGTMPDVAGLTLFGRWAGDLKIDATVSTSGLWSAENLGRLVKGAVALLNLSSTQMGQDKRIARLLGSLKMKTGPDFVRISTTIPASLILQGH